MRPTLRGLVTAIRADMAVGLLLALFATHPPPAVAQDLGPMLDLGDVIKGFPELGGFLPPQGNHHANVSQDGDRNRLAAVQQGWQSRIDVQQVGTGNSASLEQTGALHVILLNQEGIDNFTAIQQGGLRNAARVGQVGMNNVAEVVQIGVGLKVDIVQNGSNNVARVFQR